MTDRQRAAPPSPGFRGDIQGLRAFAVISVILDHVGLHVFSGGYVGVDVFFVISGFLITGLLLKSYGKERVDLVDFYAKRARRILPAAAVVIVATSIASIIMLTFVRAQDALSDGVWSALFFANVKFASTGTDYFASDEPPSVFQHFWSLSVEEQFYLVWPVLLALLMFGMAWRRRRARPELTAPSTDRVSIVLVIAILASLAWSIRQTSEQPAAAYFSAFARAWELGTGALLATLAVRITHVPAKVRAVGSWIGLAGVCTAVVVFDRTTPFPGYAAALPVVGTALIIAGGIGQASPLGAGVILGRQPLRYVGDISYSLYLWHWPFLQLAAGYAGKALPLSTNLLLVAGAVVVSVLSYHFVENPFRHSSWLSREPRNAMGLWPASLLVILLVSEVGRISLDDRQFALADQGVAVVTANATPKPGTDTLDPVVAAVRASVEAVLNDAPIPGGLIPTVANLRGDIFSPGSGCVATSGQGTSRICKLGDTAATRSMLVIGDSHASMWVPALDSIGRQAHWGVYYLAKGGCTSAEVTLFYTSGVSLGCTAWRHWALGQVASLRPELAIVATRAPDGSGTLLATADGKRMGPGAVPNAWRAGVATTVRTLQSSAKRVVVLGDTPKMGQNPVDCIPARDATMRKCSAVQSSLLGAMNREAAAAATAERAEFIDPNPWFCASRRCPMVIGQTIAFRDDDHVTTTYMKQLARVLGQALSVLPKSVTSSSSPASAVIASVEASVQAVLNSAAIPAGLTPSIANLRSDVFAAPKGCVADSGDGSSRICKLGDTGAQRTMLVIGDSHASMWVPALDAIGRQAQWGVYYLVKNGCTSADVTIFSTERETASLGCNTWRAWALDQVAKLRPTLSIMANRAVETLATADGKRMPVGDVPDAWEAGIAVTARKLRASSERVVVLGATPKMAENPVDCIPARDASMRKCSTVQDGLLISMNRVAQASAKAEAAEYVDVDQWFCASRRCPMVIGRTVAFRDREHITTTYAKQLTSELGRSLSVLPG